MLGEILRGGAERVSAADTVIAGGHSVRDREVKYGLSVTGVIHPDRIMTNGGAMIGDSLVLTKPIGSGVLTSAAMAGKISESDLAEAIDVMADLNAGACEAMLEIGVHSVTDITGFGLIGHAYEMAAASAITIELEAHKVPLLENTLRLAGDGIVTRTHTSNLEHVGDNFESKGVDDTLVKVLADAQTSGGLLIAVAADRVDQLVEALKTRKTRAAAVVGRVKAGSQRAVVLR